MTVRRHIEFVTANFEAFGDHRTKDALAWLSSNEPSPVDVPSIIHGDLWPANVLMQRGRLSGLVDWKMAGIGDPALDLGYACAGSGDDAGPAASAATDTSGNPRGRHEPGTANQRAILRQNPNDHGAHRVLRSLRCLVELSAVLPYRHRSIGTSVAAQRPPWDKGVSALVRHFQKMSGVPIAIE